MFDIAVVGIGATGISLLQQIQDQVCASNLRSPRIILFGADEDFARGKAFGDAGPYHKVNTPSSMMALSESEPNGFTDWIGKSKALRSNYPNRRAYSTFLHEAYQSIYGSDILDIEEIRALVTDIEPYNEGYRLISAGRAVTARKVVMCLGALYGPTFPSISDKPHFYDHHNQISGISGERLLMGGTSLTAVDFFRTLNANQNNEVHLFSRQGNAPTCITYSATCTPSILTWQNLQRSHPYCEGLMGLLVAIRDECKALPIEAEHKPAMRIWREKGLSHYFDYLMDRAKESNLPFQDVLVSTRPYMHILWRGLSISERVLFNHKYGAMWAAWRHPIPLEIMTELTNAAKEGRLLIHQSRGMPTWEHGKFHVPVRSGQTISSAMFVDGTGGSNQLNVISSILIQNLLRRHMIESHPCGGMNVNSLTYECRVNGRSVPRFYNLGPLNKGSLFSTNAFWFNAQCAGHWARQWAIGMTQKTEEPA